VKEREKDERKGKKTINKKRKIIDRREIRKTKKIETNSIPAPFQVLELRVADDEEAAAVRRRAQAADGAAPPQLRRHEDVRQGAAGGQADRQQDPEGDSPFYKGQIHTITMHIKFCQQHCIVYKTLKPYTLAGFEPGLFCSVGGRDGHYATSPGQIYKGFFGTSGL
jgi:hypothetical protein